jgi:hypothetical protein
VNDERTRSFVAVKVDQGEAKVLQLIQSVDEVLAKYKQPVYYKVRGPGGLIVCRQRFDLVGDGQEPSLHISIASCLGDVSEVWAAGDEAGDDDEEVAEKAKGDEDALKGLRAVCDVSVVECKIGKKLFAVPLL